MSTSQTLQKHCDVIVGLWVGFLRIPSLHAIVFMVLYSLRHLTSQFSPHGVLKFRSGASCFGDQLHPTPDATVIGTWQQTILLMLPDVTVIGTLAGVMLTPYLLFSLGFNYSTNTAWKVMLFTYNCGSVGSSVCLWRVYLVSTRHINSKLVCISAFAYFV